MTGRRRLSWQPISRDPPWTKSNNRHANGTWNANFTHSQEQLDMRYRKWRRVLSKRWFQIVGFWRITFDVVKRCSMHCYVKEFPSVPDEMPFWYQQVPVASSLPHDCCFRSWYAHKPSSQLRSHAPSWVPPAQWLLWWDGSRSRLLSAVARRA